MAIFDAARTVDEILLEELNHEIILWLVRHPGCESDLEAYHQTLDHVAVFPLCNDELTHLYVVAAKDCFRSLYGYSWDLKR